MIDRRARSLFTPTALEGGGLEGRGRDGGQRQLSRYCGVVARVNGTKTIEFRFRRV